MFQRQSKDFLVVIPIQFTHSDSIVAEPDPEQGHKPAQRYRWPLFVIAGVVLGILLAVLWLSFEIRRTERIRQLNSPGGQLTP
jgi:flagellar biosynthesis/type III secretory pathway M-ring protein FliF/YscJ